MNVPLNAWIGPRYYECGRVLVMCESTYGMVDSSGVQMLDQDYFPIWFERYVEWRDPTCNAIFKACAANGDDRRAVFERIAYCNLVPDNLGATNKSKVTTAQLRAGAATLPERLAVLAPRVVWVASTKAHKTRGVVEAIIAAGARPVLSVHPASWHGPHAALVAAWAECRALPSGGAS